MKRYELLQHQKDAIKAVLENINNTRSPLLLDLVSGSGKTVVLTELIKQLSHEFAHKRILILTARTEIKYQLKDALLQADVFYKTDDFYESRVCLSTYAKVKNTYSRYTNLPIYDFVICCDAHEAKDINLLKYFKNAIIIGFGHGEVVNNGWFSGSSPIYSYTYENAVYDGLFMPSENPRSYDIAVLGFIRRIFSQFYSTQATSEYKSIFKMDEFKPDLMLNIGNEMVVIECKSYRNRNIPIQTLDYALNQMKQYTQKNCKCVIILFGEAPELFKREAFEKYNITIWDISNLIYYCKNSTKLLNELTQLIRFPFSDIKPLPSSGWSPHFDVAKEIEIAPSAISEELEKRLIDCKTGKSNCYDYEKICEDIIQYLFGDEFTVMSNQHKTSDDLFRMDLICSLKGSSAFWELLMHHYNSRFIVFEFKNYSKALSQNLIFITEKYLFDAALRNVAIVLSQKDSRKMQL